MVKVKAQFKRRSTANNVEIYVPVPDDADTPKFRVCLKACVSDLFQLMSLAEGIDWDCTICARQIGVRLEDQATGWWPRIPHESALRSA